MADTPSRRAFVGAGIMGTAALAAGPAHDPDPPLAPPDAQPPGLKLPDPPATRAGWAVVGLGVLSLDEILPAFALCKRSRLSALVSGHPEKARKVAAAYGIDPKRVDSYDTYARMADARDIDVVYVVLPNSMHEEYTVRALEAGKHVFCEKPMAHTPAACVRMIAAAAKARRRLAVAYRLHYEPNNLRVMRLCREKAYGPIRTFEASNCQDVKAPNIRLSRELAGGPVEDIGVYCINAANYVTGERPAEVSSSAHWPKDDRRFREVPQSVAFTLRYPGGVIAHCGCSFASAVSRRYRVHCDAGLIEMDPAFAYRGLRLSLHENEQRREATLPEVNQFAAEMDHFSACVLDGKATRTPGEMGLADARVIDAVAEAARTGRSVKVRY